MKKFIAIFVALMMVTSLALAGLPNSYEESLKEANRLNIGAVICDTESSIDNLILSVATGDEVSANALVASGQCAVTDTLLPIRIIEQRPSGVVKAYMFYSHGYLIIWTLPEFIEGETHDGQGTDI